MPNNGVDTSKLFKQFDALKKIDFTSSAKEGAEIILERAQELVPVDTGELLDSGGVIEVEDGYAVQFSAEHAGYVEFGTSKMEAQPYLRPSIDEKENEILKAIGEDVQDKIAKEV